MEYLLKFGHLFDKEFAKLDKSIKEEAWKKILRLKENPNIGKHLRHLNLWELHVRMFRIFYFVDNNHIFLLTMKHKDETDKYIRSLSMEEIRRQLTDVS